MQTIIINRPIIFGSRGSMHKVQGRTGSQGQSRQQAYNLYNKLRLALTLTLTLPCDPVVLYLWQ